jgi:hypothetical protein
MAPTQLGEYLFGRPSPAVNDIVLALPNCLVNIGASGCIEYLLASFSFR